MCVERERENVCMCGCSYFVYIGVQGRNWACRPAHPGLVGRHPVPLPKLAQLFLSAGLRKCAIHGTPRRLVPGGGGASSSEVRGQTKAGKLKLASGKRITLRKTARDDADADGYHGSSKQGNKVSDKNQLTKAHLRVRG